MWGVVRGGFEWVLEMEKGFELVLEMEKGLRRKVWRKGWALVFVLVVVVVRGGFAWVLEMERVAEVEEEEGCRRLLLLWWWRALRRMRKEGRQDTITAFWEISFEGMRLFGMEGLRRGGWDEM